MLLWAFAWIVFTVQISHAVSPQAQKWVDEGLKLSKTKPDSPEEADCYRKAVEIDPAYGAAHFNLGFVLDAQSRKAWRGTETSWADVDGLSLIHI